MPFSVEDWLVENQITLQGILDLVTNQETWEETLVSHFPSTTPENLAEVWRTATRRAAALPPVPGLNRSTGNSASAREQPRVQIPPELREQMREELIARGYNPYSIDEAFDAIRAVNGTREIFAAMIEKLKLTDSESTQIVLAEYVEPLRDQIKRYVSLSGVPVSRSDIFSAMTKLDISEDLLKAFEHICEYQGFDPATTIKKLIEKNDLARQVAMVRWSFNVTIDGTERVIEITNHQTLGMDMYFLITVFCTRGSMIKKILKKSRPDFSTCFRGLVDKYGVVQRDQDKKKDPLPREAITLPRMALVFPMIPAHLLTVGVARSPPNNPVTAKYPLAVFAPGFASMLPRNLKTTGGEPQNINCQMFLVAIVIDDQLHPQPDTKTPLSSMVSFFASSLISTVIVEKARVLYCLWCGVVWAFQGAERVLFDEETFDDLARAVDATRDLRFEFNGDMIASENEAINQISKLRKGPEAATAIAQLAEMR